MSTWLYGENRISMKEQERMGKRKQTLEAEGLSLSEGKGGEHVYLQSGMQDLHWFVPCQVVTRGSLELKVDQSRCTDLQGNVINR